jgi:LysM repeat protein
MKILEMMKKVKFLKHMSMEKRIRNTIIVVVVSGVTFAAAAIALKGINLQGSMNHNMASNAKDSTEHSIEHNVTADNGQTAATIKAEDKDSVNSSGNANSESVNSNNSNLNTVPDDVVFVKYTVKANDTLWRIADTYMPEYNAHPEGDKEGVIAFIVKENKLQKANNGSYIIYTGQSLTIPKQKTIALSIDTSKSNKAVNSTNNTSNTNKSSAAKQSSQNSSVNSTSNTNTSNSSNTVDTSTAASGSQTVQNDQTDHSSHTSHN